MNRSESTSAARPPGLAVDQLFRAVAPLVSFRERSFYRQAEPNFGCGAYAKTCVMPGTANHEMLASDLVFVFAG